MPSHDTGYGFAVLCPDTPREWYKLERLCDWHLEKRDIRRFREILGHSCKTIIVEREYVCKDYRDTYTNFYAKKFAAYPGKCVRLFFFGARVVDLRSWWNVDEYKDSFVGYSVIRPTRVNPIGRTVLKPGACATVKGYVCEAEYRANLAGVQLRVTGFPSISQDTDVTVCAHAASWMCFRYYSERYPNYAERYPFQITQLTTDLSGGRLVPSHGLYMEQVAEMFSRFGFYPLIYIRTALEDASSDPELFERILYYYIESGLPFVAGAPNHAFTVIGHASDFAPLPSNGEPRFTSDYMTGLIVNDDNELPYLFLPTDRHPAAPGHVSRFKLSQVDSFVVPLPEKVYISAEEVETLTLSVLKDPGLGLGARSARLRLDDLVIRVFLTTSRAYKQYRRQEPLPNDLTQAYTSMAMPQFIWVAELSTDDLYRKKSILGEVIWDATGSSGDKFSWLVIHYPEYLVLNDRDSHDAGLYEFDLPDPSEYALYEHNLHEVV